MVNKQKRKGSDWEREFVKLIETVPEIKAKRIAGSGALGAQLQEPALLGDVVFVIDDFPKKFRVECKTGYGNATQFTIKREWFDKIKQEAEQTFSIPVVALKFSNVREANKVKYVLAFDFESFVILLDYIIKIKKELDKLYDEKSLGRNN